MSYEPITITVKSQLTGAGGKTITHSSLPVIVAWVRTSHRGKTDLLWKEGKRGGGPRKKQARFWKSEDLMERIGRVGDWIATKAIDEDSGRLLLDLMYAEVSRRLETKP